MLHHILETSEALDFQRLWMKASNFDEGLLWIQKLSAKHINFGFDYATLELAASSRNQVLIV